MQAGFQLRSLWVAWWYRAVFARLSGQRDTIRANLARAFADKGAGERRSLERRVLRNQARFYGEILNFDRFLPLVGEPEIEGAGKAAFFEAVAAKRPVILVTGHVGNYVAGLAMLSKLGIEAGFLYRTRGTALLDSRFDDIIAQAGQRGFKISHRKFQGFEGNLKAFMAYLAAGNPVVMLADHRDRKGERLRFLGHRAPTSLTPAQLALKYDAPLIPCFVLREGRGSRFRVVMEAPIRHTRPTNMMRTFNDHLSALIEAEPAQWCWTIRRW
jgi:KDO2-lipid IV(A) lauroyltransferase